MIKKRSLLIKLSSFLLASAPIIAINPASAFGLGEPQLPKINKIS